MDVLKIGGNELDNPAFLQGLAASVAAMETAPVIVHGGGRAIASLQERLGLTPVMIDGLRVTDAASLEVAQMVLSGQANKLIVTALFVVFFLANIIMVPFGWLAIKTAKHILSVPREILMKDLRDETETVMVIEEVEVGTTIPRKMFSQKELERGGR